MKSQEVRTQMAEVARVLASHGSSMGAIVAKAEM